MQSADWYFAEADLLRARADACLALAEQLAGAQLFDLHRYSGEATWVCPAATAFDEELALHCARLQGAIDQLRSNAIGLAADADDRERQGLGALEAARQAAG
jgi:hypothetical protein